MLLPTSILNADVLEVIAEHACGTVADACALRGSCKGYRRAVDTTVRRLVYEDQPELRTSREATLRVHRDSDHLDAVRIAFTCDRFPVIARLVVVAFGLDGPKDNAREGSACGERPLDCDRHPLLAATRASVRPSAPPATLWSSAPAPLHAALRHCVTSAFSAITHLAALVPREGEEHPSTWIILSSPWPRLTQLSCLESGGGGGHPQCRSLPDDDADDDEGVLLRLLSSVGPQLSSLQLEMISERVCPALATCGRLADFEVVRLPRSAAASALLCDALIASGAALRRVDAPGICAADGLRLLHAVPSIVEAAIRSINPATLPPPLSERMLSFNRVRGPRAAQLSLFYDEALAVAVPAPWVAEVNMGPIAMANPPDLAVSYPNLRGLHTGVITDSHIAVLGRMAFPTSLERISFNAATDGAAEAILRRFEGRRRGFDLTSLTIVSRAFVNFSPVAVFAATLRTLTIDTRLAWPATAPAAVEAAEGAVSQLELLEEAQLFALPTARCFLGGRHRRLRLLTVECINAPDAPLSALAKACPKLLHASSWNPTSTAAAKKPPAGWVATTSAAGDAFIRASCIDVMRRARE